MNVYLPFMVTLPLLAAVLFTEADPSATHVDERPPNIKEIGPNPQSPYYTFSEPLILPAPFPSERAEYTEPTQEPNDHFGNAADMVTAMPTPTVALPVYAQPKLTPAIDVAVAECRQRGDRYDWQTYALAAGFPPDVVAGSEMANVIHTESGGDLCAVNTSSKAACWAQILSSAGIEQQIAYLDPTACMSAAYAKWVDGGRDFWRHWYQWWVR